MDTGVSNFLNVRFWGSSGRQNQMPDCGYRENFGGNLVNIGVNFGYVEAITHMLRQYIYKPSKAT